MILDQPLTPAKDAITNSFVPHPCPAAATMLGIRSHPVPGPRCSFDCAVDKRVPFGGAKAIALHKHRQARRNVTAGHRGVSILGRKQRHPPHGRVDHVLKPGAGSREIEVDQRYGLPRAKDNVLGCHVEVTHDLWRRRWRQLGRQFDGQVVPEPASVSRRDKRGRRSVQALEQHRDGAENTCRRGPRFHDGLTRDFARDELEDVTTLLVDSKETRRFSKANTLKMQEIRGDRIGPWAARPSDGVADAHDIVSDVAAQERGLRAIRWSR